jgi:hypothetical protein
MTPQEHLDATAKAYAMMCTLRWRARKAGKQPLPWSVFHAVTAQFPAVETVEREQTWADRNAGRVWGE